MKMVPRPLKRVSGAKFVVLPMGSDFSTSKRVSHGRYLANVALIVSKSRPRQSLHRIMMIGNSTLDVSLWLHIHYVQLIYVFVAFQWQVVNVWCFNKDLELLSVWLILSYRTGVLVFALQLSFRSLETPFLPHCHYLISFIMWSAFVLPPNIHSRCNSSIASLGA